MIIDERIEIFINSLAKEYPDYLMDIEKQAIADEVPVIRKSMQGIMKYLMVTKQPENILEIGTAVGFSSLLMREYAKTARITTIENYPPRINEARANFEKYDSDGRITLIGDDAQNALKKLTGEYDFVFMDAAKGQYMTFFEDVLKLVKPGGIIVSDNVLQDGDIIQSRYAVKKRNRTIHSRMRDYLYYLTHNDKLETIIIPLGDGLTISTIIDKE